MKRKSKILSKKKLIRKNALIKRKKISINSYYASFAAMKYFFRCFSVSKDDVIGCYWPIQDELDTRPLISELIKKKIKIALPVILDNCMLFKSWNIKDSLFFSKYKFYGPSMKSSTLKPNIIITPALAVDLKGNRIGYGKGFYDKYYNIHKSENYVGYSYSQQIFKTLPFNQHDLKLNTVVTDNFVKIIKNENK